MNRLSFFVATVILFTADFKKRIEWFEKFIEIATELRKLNNYSSVMAVKKKKKNYFYFLYFFIFYFFIFYFFINFLNFINIFINKKKKRFWLVWDSLIVLV